MSGLFLRIWGALSSPFRKKQYVSIKITDTSAEIEERLIKELEKIMSASDRQDTDSKK